MEFIDTMKLAVHGISHTGLVRARNEDALRIDSERGYAIVADGMGGLPGGDRASMLATQALGDFLDRFDTGVSEETLATGLEGAQTAVLEEAFSEPSLTGMGTTLTAVSLRPAEGTFVLGHVGDSRAYLYRDATLTRLTRDHTVAQERVDRGVLDQYDAESHPTAHLLTQSVGSSHGIWPDFVTGSVEDGDLLILCTDGLTKVLSDEGLRTILLAGDETLEGLAQRFVDASLNRGGPDNVTVVLIGVGAAP
jgi:serine/threonine protein phosphatase PrpC